MSKPPPSPRCPPSRGEAEALRREVAALLACRASFNGVGRTIVAGQPDVAATLALFR